MAGARLSLFADRKSIRLCIGVEWENTMVKPYTLGLGVLLAVVGTGTALGQYSGGARKGAANTTAITGNLTAKGSSANGVVGTTPASQHQPKTVPTTTKAVQSATKIVPNTKR
jgi:hypothetical protein